MAPEPIFTSNTSNDAVPCKDDQERRRIQRLTFMYKILNGQVAVPADLTDLELSVYVQAEETITNRSS